MKQAWAEIRFYWKKYLMIELLIILMMFMVVFLTGLAGGLAEQSAGAIKDMPVQGFILAKDAKGLLADSSMTMEEAEELKAATSGNVTALSVERSAFKKDGRDEKLDVVYFAIEEDSFLTPEVTSGSDLEAGQNLIILSQEFQEEGLEIGDEIIDSKSDLILKVAGFTERQTYTFAPTAFISQETHTELRQAINPTVKEAYQSLALASEQAEVALVGFESVTKDTLIGQVPGYAAQQLTINLISGVLLFVSAAILGIFFYILSLQKRQQFGVMRAIGLSLGEIVGIQFVQGFLLALIGVVLGNALAIGTMSALPSKVPVAVDWTSALVASLIFISMAVFSILVSCLQISKIDPVKIIGGGEA